MEGFTSTLTEKEAAAAACLDWSLSDLIPIAIPL